ncbi:DUF2974 domain-containing protein [Lachnoclostridium pacaense]|uniref:Mbeg1-like protein n=1 Tax=Enterocloster hominis (ex Hitch et al. 2024) TaxID=1917870 RepID=UPI001D10B71E|nr:Mbeg1-like protein [Lachnoclostridium pacaense]MCC2817192.1 DUF2974 domain-containing protein [Lachnoclostridium pacaense]
MANIIDYVRWRGDLTFQEKQFNEVDNLIFSLLSYFDFKEIVAEPEAEKEISLKEACEAYGELHGAKKVPELLCVMASANRFKNLRLSGYVDIFDRLEQKTQFAAMRIFLENGVEYIVFRGTDETIVGWQEDFSMSFRVIPAQNYALDYLSRVLEKSRNQIYLGGHSKGGNLALYAAAMQPETGYERILKIFSNDGPGLCPDIISINNQKRLQEKLVRIIPDFSIIGTLFEERQADFIVKSSVDGLLEHDAYTWLVEGEFFLRASDLTEKCKQYNRVFNEWIGDVGLEQREIFTKDFFDALASGGAITMGEVAAGRLQKFEDILFTFGSSRKESKFVIGKLLKSFVKGICRIDFLELLHTKKILQGSFILLFGILFVCLPDLAAEVVGTACFLGLLLYSLFRLFQFYKNFKAEEPVNKYKALFYGVIAGIETLCIIQNNIILLSVNLLLGVFFLWHAWKEMQHMTLQKACKRRAWVLYFMDCLVSGVFGIVALAISNKGSGDFMLAAGTYLILLGFTEAIRAMYETIPN